MLAALATRPSGRYLRIAGFLWEAFTGQRLEPLPVLSGATVPVFDPARYITAPGVR